MRILRLANVFSLAGIFLLLCAGFALSQETGEAEMPRQTEPLYVAMIFHKLTDMPPDVYSWAKHSKEYLDADSFEREGIVSQKVKEFAKVYNLISPLEMITLNTTVKLSPFDPAIPGFTTKSFNNGKVAFPVQYMDENFRLVPEGISGMQRIVVSAEFAKEIWQDTENGSNARVELQLAPFSAVYEENPLEVKGTIYWPPLRTRVESFRIWSADRKKVLWENHPKDTSKGEISGFFPSGQGVIRE